MGETAKDGFEMSLWYRAPEVIVSTDASFKYTPAVDVWSFGCIVYELFAQRSLFNGSDDLSQLVSILQTIGVTSEYIETLSPTLGLREKLAELLGSIPFTPEFTIFELIPEANEVVIDLISKTLELDPTQRMTLDDVLDHRWFLEFKDDQDEQVSMLSPDQLLCSIEEPSNQTNVTSDVTSQYWVDKVYESVDDFSGDMDLLFDLAEGEHGGGGDDQHHDYDDDDRDANYEEEEDELDGEEDEDEEDEDEMTEC